MQEVKSFLQSKEWGQFQESLGRRVFWLDEILLIQMPLRLGRSYLYSPRCSDRVLGKDFLRQLKKFKKRRHIFFRLEPNIVVSQNLVLGNNFEKLDFDLQPSKTLILDLTKNEEKILAAMHPKTRYNIRLAEKHGVKIKKGEEYFDDFWRLLKITAARDGIRPFSENYYRQQLIVTDDFRTELWVAEYEKEIIAANLVNFYGDIVTYLHGASSDKHRNVMSTFLLQWEQIKEGRKRGFKKYDFWGFDEQRWPGVSRFKKGFGGKAVEYAGAFDLVWSRTWYWAYKIAKKLL